MTKPIFLICGWLAFALGFVGAFLPILPTTPFMLLAAYCFSKGSPRLYKWLINLPKFGPSIKAWNENGVISKRAKVICVISVVAVMIYLGLHDTLPLWAQISSIVILFGVMGFVCSRPST